MTDDVKAGEECEACGTYAYYCSESLERDDVCCCSDCTHWTSP